LLILSIEALNTAIEYTCDKITMDKSNKIKKAKDLGSAAIFLSLTAYGIVLFLGLFN
jgi:diacylglycerol kinase (ATP)